MPCVSKETKVPFSAFLVSLVKEFNSRLSRMFKDIFVKGKKKNHRTGKL